MSFWLAISWASAWAIDCDEPSTEDCACIAERARTVTSALADIQAGPWRTTEPGWRQVMATTCEWADRLSPEGEGSCGRAMTCVRLHGEDRLATLSAASPSARAIDLARSTGRWDCGPADGEECANKARDAEDERLMVVVGALAEAGAPLLDSQRLWFSYRDSGCALEAAMVPSSADWSRAACAAVLSERRIELLAMLASTDPTAGPLVEEARWRAAERAAPGGRAWQRWMDEEAARLQSAQGGAPAPEVRRLLREALEARADRAALPALAHTEAHARCEDVRSLACAAAIRAETGAIREVEVSAAAVHEGWLRAERTWRARWCGALQGTEALLCEAAIDWIVITALRS